MIELYYQLLRWRFSQYFSIHGILEDVQEGSGETERGSLLRGQLKSSFQALHGNLQAFLKEPSHCDYYVTFGPSHPSLSYLGIRGQVAVLLLLCKELDNCQG